LPAGQQRQRRIHRRVRNAHASVNGWCAVRTLRPVIDSARTGISANRSDSSPLKGRGKYSGTFKLALMARTGDTAPVHRAAPSLKSRLQAPRFPCVFVPHHFLPCFLFRAHVINNRRVRIAHASMNGWCAVRTLHFYRILACRTEGCGDEGTTIELPCPRKVFIMLTNRLT
jgi:hypothetical protein